MFTPPTCRPWLLAAALCLPLAAAQADDAYPTRTIQIIVPYAPGGSTDFAARHIARYLEADFKQSVVVVNRPGASGSIGVTAVARAPADGYTLLLGLNTEMVILPQIRSLSYETADLTPIAIVGSTPLVLIGNQRFQADTFPALTAEIQQRPGSYNFGGALGSPAHLAGQWLRQTASIDIRHVPYKGGAQAANDVAGGHLDLYFSGILPSKTLIDSGGIKAYAVTSAERSPILPQVPTLKESGLSEFILENWSALYAPRGTPPAIVERLRHRVDAVLRDPAFQATMAQEGISIPLPASASQFLNQEHEKFGRLIKTLGITAEK